jgi:hypothetical protein
VVADMLKVIRYALFIIPLSELHDFSSSGHTKNLKHEACSVYLKSVNFLFFIYSKI